MNAPAADIAMLPGWRAPAALSRRSLYGAIALSLVVHAAAAVWLPSFGRALPDALLQVSPPLVLRMTPTPEPAAEPVPAPAPRLVEPAHSHPHPHVPVKPEPRATAKAVPKPAAPTQVAALPTAPLAIPHADPPQMQSLPRDEPKAETAPQPARPSVEPVAAPAPASPPANAAPTSTPSATASAAESAPAAKSSNAQLAAISAQGDRFEPPHYNLAYLNNPRPDYPAAARRMRLEGLVVVRALVSPGGRVDEIKLHASSGAELLDEAAMRAVRGWQFVPAKRGEQPVAHWAEIPIRFRLSE
jgi:protein TonB